MIKDNKIFINLERRVRFNKDRALTYLRKSDTLKNRNKRK